MANISNVSHLRYGFDLDKSSFLDIGTRAQLIMSLVNTFIFQPFPVFILLRKSRTMSASIRRGYIVMHLSYMTYDIIFFLLARIYVLMPWSGLYCEGPLCRIGLPRGLILGLIAFSIVLIQPPFAFLIIRMHQMLVPMDSCLKLSKRVQISMASIQLTLMSLNVVGFVLCGDEPYDIDAILQEPEIAYYANRGQVLLFGRPGYPQNMKYELVFFYITLLINFPVLCVFIFHSMANLRQTKLNAKSTQTQRLTQTMFEVFFLQLTGVTISHVIPLMTLMIALWVNIDCFGDVALAACKLLFFTLNSTQFCLIFVLKNPTHRHLLMSYLWSIRRLITNSKVEPADAMTPIRNQPRQSLFSMTVM